MRVSGGLRKVVEAQKSTDLLFTPRFELYVARNRDLILTDEEAEWVKAQTTAVPRDRTQSFSASARGRCEREQLLQFHGVEGKARALDAKTSLIFIDGTWRHLRLQLLAHKAGIIEDLWDDTEVAFRVPTLRLKGSADGVGRVESGEDRFGIEFKGCNTYTWRKVTEEEADAKREHILQVASYDNAWEQTYPDVDPLVAWSIVYEHKDTQEYKEHVYTREELEPWKDKAHEELSRLNNHVHNQTLPPVLPNLRTGTAPCSWCDFKDVCPDIEALDLIPPPAKTNGSKKTLRLRRPT